MVTAILVFPLGLDILAGLITDILDSVLEFLPSVAIALSLGMDLSVLASINPKYPKRTVVRRSETQLGKSIRNAVEDVEDAVDVEDSWAAEAAMEDLEDVVDLALEDGVD